MRILKMISMGLAAALIFSTACLGVSAATPPAALSTGSGSTPVASAAEAASAKAQLAQIYDSLSAAQTTRQLSANAAILPAFNYGSDGGPGMHTIIFTYGSVIQQGDVGHAVRELQTDLNELGESLTVDGNFGSGTNTGVRAFQTFYNNNFGSLTVDGKVGRATYYALRSACHSYGMTFHGTD